MGTVSRVVGGLMKTRNNSRDFGNHNSSVLQKGVQKAKCGYIKKNNWDQRE